MSNEIVTISAREFRTRLGTYLARARRGEIIHLTHRGKPVAELAPLSTPAEPNTRRVSAKKSRKR